MTAKESAICAKIMKTRDLFVYNTHITVIYCNTYLAIGFVHGDFWPKAMFVNLLVTMIAHH